MSKEDENRLGLAGQTSQVKTPRESCHEWPAIPVVTVEVSDGNGRLVKISFVDWLAKIGNNNRGGT